MAEYTAKKGDVLYSKSYVGADTDDDKGFGTMSNNGTVVVEPLNAGETYNIPTGFHTGQAEVTSNSLASQTVGDAEASDIWSGQTAWVNGVKVTGVGSVTGLGAWTGGGGGYVAIAWNEPGRGFYDGLLITAGTNSSLSDPTMESHNAKVTVGTTSWSYGVSTSWATTVYFRIRPYCYVNGTLCYGATQGTYSGTSVCTSYCSCTCKDSCACVSGGCSHSCPTATK